MRKHGFSAPRPCCPRPLAGREVPKNDSRLVSWDSGSLGTPNDQNVEFFATNGASSGPSQKVGSADATSRGELAFSPSGYALDVFTTTGPSSTAPRCCLPRPGRKLRRAHDA